MSPQGSVNQHWILHLVLAGWKYDTRSRSNRSGCNIGMFCGGVILWFVCRLQTSVTRSTGRIERSIFCARIQWTEHATEPTDNPGTGRITSHQSKDMFLLGREFTMLGVEVRGSRFVAEKSASQKRHQQRECLLLLMNIFAHTPGIVARLLQ